MENKDPSVSNAPNTDVSNTDQVKDQTVAYETFQKAVGQKKAFQEKASAFEKENADLKKQIEGFKNSAQEEKARADGDWKALLEAKDQKINQLSQERDEAITGFKEASGTLDNAVKLNAVYEQLPGKIKNPAYAHFIDTTKVVINPDTGEIDSDSVKTVVDIFMMEHKDLIDTKNFKGLPGDSANGGFADPIKKYQQTELKDMRKAAPEAVRQLKKKLGLV